jgi:hypothetical protein
MYPVEDQGWYSGFNFDYWPAQRPALNAIENFWYILGKRISKRRHECNNLK